MTSQLLIYGQIVRPIGDHWDMDKMQLRQVFATNVVRRMQKTPGLDTQTALAKKARISQPYLSELLRCMSAPTTDSIAGIAEAFGCEPWELLTDADATRRAAVERMLGLPPVEERYPVPPAHRQPAPVKEVALRRRKKGGSNGQDHR